VDCALIEPDGITVIDFKTDYVTDETIGLITDRYRTQIDTYANALERIFSRKIKARYLYLFHLEQFVPV
jgi:ATP-dependent helicase/nuclease subunit A